MTADRKNRTGRNVPAGGTACWIALACLVVPMFASYFFDDMFSTLSHIFQNPDMLALGWDSAGYGFYAGGYSFLCVCGGLVVCGVLLDMFGVRTVGSVFVGLMIAGAATVLAAITSGLEPATSLTIAYIGCMLFGLGSEIAGVAVTRSIAKWFKGWNVALAMGLQLAIARLGTATAFILSPVLVAEKSAGEIYTLAETARPAIAGLCMMLAGGILWAIFVAMDARFDRDKGVISAKGKVRDEDKFRFSDILKVLTNPRFIMIALLCVFFYCCIISFKKFGTAIVIPRFDMDVDAAKWVITMIPFFTVIFTPLFGALVDKVGKATIWMMTGAVLVLCAHLIMAHNGICPTGRILLRLPCHFIARNRIFPRAFGHVAYRSQDNSGKKSRHSIFADILDTEHGHAPRADFCRENLQGHSHRAGQQNPGNQRSRKCRIHFHRTRHGGNSCSHNAHCLLKETP